MVNFKTFATATALTLAAPAALAQADAQSAPEFEQVFLVAEQLFEDEANNRIIAEGQVEATYGGRTLRADRVIFDRNTDQIRASGNVVIIDEDGTQRFADEVEVSSSLTDGYAVGFSVKLPNGGQAVANSAVRQEGGLNALDQVVYTACEICEEDDTPTWALRARRAVLDQESQMISYRDAVLEIAGVPVFYLPYLAHPDPTSERRSGLLFPDFGLSSKTGVFYQQPYYWAISDYSELTIAPTVYERVNPLLELDYSKRFWSGRLNINTSITNEFLFDGDGNKANEPDFALGGAEESRAVDTDQSWRSHIFADGIFSINSNWAWGFGLERASDDLYLARYDIDGERDIRGLYTNQPKRLLSQLFLVGQDTNSYNEVALLAFQGLRAGDENSLLPTVTPLVYSDRVLDFGSWGRTGLEASAAILTRDEGEDSQRVSLGADWSNLHILPGGLTFEPFADARVDHYALDEEFAEEDSVTRGVGSFGGRLAYPLIRSGERMTVRIEPIVMGAYGVSNANESAIPNEDTLLYEFDETSLFEPNGFTNYDLYEGDGRLAVGMSALARWDHGAEVRAVAGRRWRSRSDPAFDEFSNLDGTVSDWVAGASVDFGQPFLFESSVRLDDDSLELNRIDARLASAFWRVSGSAQYYKISDEITLSGRPEEGIALSSRFRINDRLSLVYSRLREIETNLDRSHAVGLRYGDDCSVFEISYSRSESSDRELGPSESILFRFSLRSLGEFGSADVD